MSHSNNASKRNSSIGLKDPEDTGRCGILWFRPNCLQKFRRFEYLIACMCVYGLFVGILNALKGSMVTTLEKRFEWSTRRIGLVLSANDIGYMSTVLFVAYFGGMSHRPRLLAISGTLYGLANMMLAFPYFRYGPKYSAEEIFQFGKKINSSMSVSNSLLCLSARQHELQKQQNAQLNTDRMIDAQSSMAFGTFMLSGVIEGIAASPFWNVGFSLIDDITKEWSGLFIGILLILRSLAPVLGYVIGGGFIAVHESLGGLVSSYPPGQKDVMWIGAWWLGIFVSASCLLFCSIFMYCFPPYVPLRKTPQFESLPNKSAKDKSFLMKLMEKNKQLNDNDEEINPTEEKVAQASLLGMLKAFKRLFSTPTYLFLFIGNCFEFIAVNVFISYFSKYIEQHFKQSASFASLATAFCMPASYMTGILISSVVELKFKMNRVQLARYHAIANSFAFFVYVTGLLFSCYSVNFTGSAPQTNLTLPCQNNCTCGTSTFRPICVNGSNTYYSPCMAGCTSSHNRTYFNCSCAGNLLTKAEEGICKGPCSSVIAYMILVYIFKSLQSSARCQEAVLTLRCAQKRDKTLGLGTLSFMWGITAVWVPTTIGAMFDKACILKSFSKSGRKFCLLYDSDKMRYVFNGFASIAQIFAIASFYAVWYFAHKANKNKRRIQLIREEKEATSDEKLRSLKSSQSDEEVGEEAVEHDKIETCEEYKEKNKANDN